VLEGAGARLGIVTAISGQRRLSVVVDGVAGHAGTIPMNDRADALCAASELVLMVEQAAIEAGDAVATVGRLLVAPNQTNIVPGDVLFRVDARSADDARAIAIERRLRERAAEVAAARGVRVAIETLEVRDAVPMEPRMRALVSEACRALDPDAIEIASGAGHDAMCIAQIAPAAMIFVPSIGGHSHIGAELTAPSDLELGVEALTAVLTAAAERDW
jgi:hydantoinase/carbamoylase family amidase